MQFGPVMSPRLPLWVRLLPGQISNWPLLGRLGGFKNYRNFVRSIYDIWLWVVRYMKLCCGSLGMKIRAGERYTYTLM